MCLLMWSVSCHRRLTRPGARYVSANLQHGMLPAGRVGHRRCNNFDGHATENEVGSSERAVLGGIGGVAAVGDRVEASHAGLPGNPTTCDESGNLLRPL